MRRLVLGDVHGAYKALIQVFKRSKFDYDNDQLIILGDVVDGRPESKQCVDELLKVKNKVVLMGNHDQWLFTYLKTGACPDVWIVQGGAATLRSYDDITPESLQDHLSFFSNALHYYLTDDNKLFVHAGIEPGVPLNAQDREILLWDRGLWDFAELVENNIKKDYKNLLENIDEIFIGHTTTEEYSRKPVRRANVWNLDQGAGWGGKLSLMDVDTKKFWSSDTVEKLYPSPVTYRR